MSTVESFTKPRLLAMEASTVVNGYINGSGHLILVQHDGTEIDAGDATVGIPEASTSVSGTVELATTAETTAMTDTVRAVTPASLTTIVNNLNAADAATNASLNSQVASLDGRLDTLEALPGSKVQVITAPAESASSTSYPVGISMCSVGSGSGWSLESGFGTIVTYQISNQRCYQTFTSHGSSGQVRQYVRTYYDTFGWSSWVQIDEPRALAPASFSQSTLLSSYPQGNSRLYMTGTETTSGGWAFAGKYGEVLTYRDGTDYAHQTWRKHQGGTASETELWVRTANNVSGWSNWRVIVGDTLAWTSYTPNLGSGTVGNGTIVSRYKQIDKTVYYSGVLTFGSTTSMGASALTISLPVARQGSLSLVGTVIMIDVSAGTGGYRVAAALEGTGQVFIVVFDGGAVFSSTPWTWATGDIIRWNIVYEAA